MLVKELKLCSKSRKCHKKDKHSGRFNTNRKIHAFWEASQFQVHITIMKQRLQGLQTWKTVRERFTKKKAILVCILSLFQSCKFLCGPFIKAYDFLLCNLKPYLALWYFKESGLQGKKNGVHCNNIYLYFISIYLLALLILLQYQLLFLFIIFC